MLHTCFDNIETDIVDTSVNLLSQKCRRNLMDVVDAQRVLCSQSSSRGHSIAAMGCNDFLVRFETSVDILLVSARYARLGVVRIRSARAVRPSNHQNSFERHVAPKCPSECQLETNSQTFHGPRVRRWEASRTSSNALTWTSTAFQEISRRMPCFQSSLHTFRISEVLFVSKETIIV